MTVTMDAEKFSELVNSMTNEDVRGIVTLVNMRKDLAELWVWAEHAYELGYFSEGGSTAGWLKDILKRLKGAKEV